MPETASLAIGPVRMQEPLMAVFVIMLVEGYFRPGELLSLQRGGLLHPTHATGSWTVLLFPQEQLRRSKTNQADDTVLMDGSRCPWMKCIYKVLASGDPAEKISERGIVWPRILWL